MLEETRKNHSAVLKLAIIGSPVQHSLSPLLHFNASQSLGIALNFDKLEFKDPIKAITVMRKEKYTGFSVTMPLKASILNHVTSMDPLTRQVKATNTLIHKDQQILAFNTDVFGVVQALKEKLPRLKNRTVIVFGAGGAARAAIVGLLKEQATVFLSNRTSSKGYSLAQEYEIEFISPQSINHYLRKADVFINATPIGMHSFPSQHHLLTLQGNLLVMDMVYFPRETPLIKKARALGCRIITGERMFLFQAIKQFELFTGITPPIPLMNKILTEVMYE